MNRDITIIPELQQVNGSGYLRFPNGNRFMTIYRITVVFDKARMQAYAEGEIESSPEAINRACVEAECGLDIGEYVPRIEIGNRRGTKAKISVVSPMPSLAGFHSEVTWMVRTRLQSRQQSNLEK